MGYNLRTWLLLAAGLATLFWSSSLLADQIGINLLWVLIPIASLVSGAIWFRFRQARALHDKDQKGVLLLNQGDLEGAAKLFDEGAADAKRKGLRHFENLLRMHRAAVWTRAGEPRRALEILLPLFAGGPEGRLNFEISKVVATDGPVLALTGSRLPRRRKIHTRWSLERARSIHARLVARQDLLMIGVGEIRRVVGVEGRSRRLAVGLERQAHA